MQENKMNRAGHLSYRYRTLLWHVMMIVLTIGGGVLVPVFRESGRTVSVWYYIFAVALAFCAEAYAFFFEPKITEGALFWLTPLLYAISYTVMLLFDRPLLMPFWCFGGILLLCAFGVRYGLLLNYFFLFLIGSTQPEPSAEAVVIQVLCLLLLGIVMFYVKRLGDVVNVIISVAAVIVSVRIVFFFILKQDILNGDIFLLAAVYTGVIAGAFLFSKLLCSDTAKLPQEGSLFLEELAASEEGEEPGAQEQSGRELPSAQEIVQKTVLQKERDREQLLFLCAEDAPLLARLSGEQPAAFLHVCRVALLARQIAEHIEGADALLVQTGGYYHEIGRLKGANTLENTLAIAEQEEFPEALRQILLTYTIKGDKPDSKEAAVLLLTDSVCSMCEHLRKTQKGKLLVVKVIDKALGLRIAKEDLSVSGLTVKDLSIIRNAMAELIKEDMF